MTRTKPVEKPVEKRAYSLAEAETASGLSISTIRHAIDNNELVASYGGPKKTKVIILADELDRWLRNLPTEKP